MELKGGTAVDLLSLGMWNSKAINEYRNMKKAEEQALYALADVELNDDEGEDPMK